MENVLSQIVEQSVNEIYIIDCETTKFLYANPSGMKNLQYSLAELKEMSAFDIKPPETHNAVREQFALLGSGDPATEKVIIKSTHIRKDGSFYPAEIHLQLTQFDNRPAYIAFIIDMSAAHNTLDLITTVTRGAGIAYWEYNIEMCTCWVSDGWLEMLGFPLDQCHNTWTSWIERIHPEDLLIGDNAMRLTMKTNEPYLIDFRIKHALGHYIWIEGSGSVLSRDPVSSRVLTFCGTHCEITKRKMGELEREQFRQFFQISPGIMLIIDDSSIIKRTNPATSMVLGYSEDELIGQCMTDFIHHDDKQLTLDELSLIAETGFAIDTENRCRCKDGSYRWLSWCACYDPKEGSVYAMARDITEHKMLSQELHKKEAMYRSLAENSDDVIIQYDKDHRHIYANPAMESHLGITPEQANGKTHKEMGFPQQLCDLWQTSIDLAFSSGESNGQIFEANNDGGTNYIDWRVFPELNNEGEVESVISVARDITLFRNHEHEVQEMQKLNSLGILAGGIAHDFNNILTIVFGNIALTKNTLPPDHPGYQTLEKAETAIHRATNLTSQLLTFAKGGDPVKRDVSINQLVEEVIRFDLSGSNVKLIFKARPDSWLVNVDANQITQVFSNLTTNANQAMPDGGHLYIDMSNKEVEQGEILGLNAGRYLKFIFSDEGVGIAPEHLHQIFDPYFTTHATHSGLGLASVFSIINKHGGHITVSSSLNLGTTFTLYLPAAKIQEASRPIDIGATITSIKSNAYILIMDDEEMILSLSAQALRAEGYTVACAADGKQAVAMYRQAFVQGQAFDCLIMDLTIPGGIGGVDALKQILRINPAAKAIVSSGYAVDPVMANYKDYGFRGIIAKPFTITTLKAVVQTVLTTSGLHDEK